MRRTSLVNQVLYHNPHFTDEETEVQSHEVTLPKVAQEASLTKSNPG